MPAAAISEGKQMDQALVVLGLLALASQGKSKTEEKKDTQEVGAGPSADPVAQSLQDVAAGAAVVLPVIVAGGKALGALGTAGAGAGAAAAGGAGGAGGAGAGAGGVAGGLKATVTFGVPGGAAAGAAAGLSFALPVTAAVVAGPLIVIGIVLAFIVAARVVAAQENDTDWRGQLLDLGVNGRDLHRIEAYILEAYLGNRQFQVNEIYDSRMIKTIRGQKIRFRGYRKQFVFLPQQGEIELFRRIRAVCEMYLVERAEYGFRLIRGWNDFSPSKEIFTWDDFKKFGAYEGLVPGLGGIKNIPHAALGRTVSPRGNPNEEVSEGSVLEAISDKTCTDTAGIVLTTEEKQVARFLALVDALRVLRWDPRPAFEANTEFYAKEVLRCLQLSAISETQATQLNWPMGAKPGLRLAGNGIALDPEVFGTNKIILPYKIKLNETGWLV